MTAETTSLNLDHHIWNNNGTFWCHYTVHRDDYTKQRVRVSLQTKDRETARARRDLVLRAAPNIAARIARALPPAYAGVGKGGR